MQQRHGTPGHRLGAQHVIDHSRDDWADGKRRYDLLLDITSNPHVGRLRRALTPRGTAVCVGGESSGAITGMRRQLGGPPLSPFNGQGLVPLLARGRSTDYEHFARLVESGQAGGLRAIPTT